MIPSPAVRDAPLGPPRLATIAPSGSDEPSLGRQVGGGQITRTRARRRWVFRTVSVLTLTAVLLCFLLTWQRDRATVEASLQRMTGAAARLQQKIDEFGCLPAVLPGWREKDGYYASDEDRFYAMRAREPIIVAAQRGLVPRILGQDGRCVILYEQGKVRPAWMTLKEFNAARSSQRQKIAEFGRQRDLRRPELP